jgi:hypothetical protein
VSPVHKCEGRVLSLRAASFPLAVNVIVCRSDAGSNASGESPQPAVHPKRSAGDTLLVHLLFELSSWRGYSVRVLSPVQKHVNILANIHKPRTLHRVMQRAIQHARKLQLGKRRFGLVVNYPSNKRTRERT